MDKKLVSIVIPTYGQPRFLQNAINSAFLQDYHHIEVVVVDDNGIDTKEQIKTEQVIQKYKGKDNFKYIKLDHNSGGGVARNTGVNAASGEYVAFLDADDLLLPGYVSHMIEQLLDYDVVYEAHWYTLYDQGCFCSKREPSYVAGDIYKQTLSNSIPISIFLLFRKRICEQAGYFNPSVRAYDDYDLWLRWTSKLRFGCLTAPYAIVRRDRDNISLTTNVGKMRQGLDYIKKHYFDKLPDDLRPFADQFLLLHNRNIDAKELIQLRLIQQGTRNEVFQNKSNNSCLHKKTYREMKRAFYRKYKMSLITRLRYALFDLNGKNETINVLKMTLFRYRYNILPHTMYW